MALRALQGLNTAIPRTHLLSTQKTLRVYTESSQYHAVASKVHAHSFKFVLPLQGMHTCS